MARILVAEDDPDIRTLVEFKLRSSGHEVVAAQDGGAAVEIASASVADEPFEVAVVDVMMPKVDGFEVCRSLKGLTPAPIVVMLTARGREDDIDMGFEAGADDYIVKPFSPRELLTRIERLLSR